MAVHGNAHKLPQTTANLHVVPDACTLIDGTIRENQLRSGHKLLVGKANTDEELHRITTTYSGMVSTIKVALKFIRDSSLQTDRMDEEALI